MVETVLLPLFIYVGYDTRGNPFLMKEDEKGCFALCDFLKKSSKTLISLRVHSQIVTEKISLWIPQYMRFMIELVKTRYQLCNVLQQ